MMTLKLRYDADTRTFVPLTPVDLDHDTVIETRWPYKLIHKRAVPAFEQLDPNDSLEALIQRMKAAAPTTMIPRRSPLTLPEMLRQREAVDPDFDLEAWQKEWSAIEEEIENALDPFPESADIR